jgi:signal transduction histidine kinase
VKLSLPWRIFTVHLIFMVALGGLGVVLVKSTFERYYAEWERELSTINAEKLFSPMVSEVARSLLLKLEREVTESRADVRTSVGEGLDKILSTLPSIERIVIVDAQLGIQYASSPSLSPVVLPAEEFGPLIESSIPVRRETRLDTGTQVIEIMLPVFDLSPDQGELSEPRRMGSVLLHYRHSARLEAELSRLYGDGVELDDGANVLLAERVFSQWAAEVARALLHELEGGVDQAHDAYRVSVSEGLSKMVDALPLDALVIVNEQRQIQYVSDPQYLGLGFTGSANAEFFASQDTVRRPKTLPSGADGFEVMHPVFDREEGAEEGAARRRIGSVVVHYQPDPGLQARLPRLAPVKVSTRDYIQPLILFIVLAVGGGILLAALTGWPVRRMERALADYAARGFKGGIDTAKVSLPKDLAMTLQAVSELGGQLETLDAQGREREALLDTLSQSLEDGMLALDPQNQPVAWNPAALRILSQGDRVDRMPTTEQSQQLEDLLAALVRNHELCRAIDWTEDGKAREIEICRADGTLALTRMTQVPFEVRPGVTGTLLLLRDLAALREVEKHLLDAGRFAVLAHLAAGLAHEIRNPLHAIQLNATVVEEYSRRFAEESSARDITDSLATIKEEAQRLTNLLNNYLGMVRPGEVVGPIDLRVLVMKVIQLLDFAARKSNVEIKLEGLESPPVVQGFASRVQQAILNLVLNAIQAMPKGGVLTLGIDSADGSVRLTVSDTGPGLPQELASQLFDTNVTTKPNGSGLGLPLVRLIAEAHGGGVWYRSIPGKGASFTLAFPMDQ